MTPDDERHGTVAGYRAGCRDECCRGAIRRYNETRKLCALRGLPTSSLVPAIGSTRRLQALMALGWSLRRVAAESDMDAPFLRRILRGEPSTVAARTAERIADIYDRLSMTVPSTTTRGDRQGVTRARNYAAARGWAPPLAWDDIDNDEAPIDVNVTGKYFDEIAVLRVLDGDANIARTLTPIERREVVRRWTGTVNELARLTGWKPERYYQDTAA